MKNVSFTLHWEKTWSEGLFLPCLCFSLFLCPAAENRTLLREQKAPYFSPFLYLSSFWDNYRLTCKEQYRKISYMLYPVSLKAKILHDHSTISQPGNWPWYHRPSTLRSFHQFCVHVCVCVCVCVFLVLLSLSHVHTCRSLWCPSVATALSYHAIRALPLQKDSCPRDHWGLFQTEQSTQSHHPLPFFSSHFV